MRSLLRSLLLAPLLFSAEATAQTEGRPRVVEEFRVSALTTAEGLPSNNVWTVREDALGFLWLATNRGLVRYDGYTFETLRPQPGDSTSLWSQDIEALHFDTAGRLWAGRAAAGHRWVGQGRNGLDRYDPATEQHTRHLYDPSTPGASLISNYVSAIAASPAEPGVLWLGTGYAAENQPAGLSRLDVAGGTFTNYPIGGHYPMFQVHTLLVDRDGTPWAGVGNSYRLPTAPHAAGLYRLDRATGTFTLFRPYPSLPNAHRANTVRAIAESRVEPGVLWIGTVAGGLHRFDRAQETFTSYDPETGRAGCSNVAAVLEDRSGTLWVGTRCGLFTFDRSTSRFTRFLHQPFRLDITDIYEDRFGTLWVSSFRGGLMRVERWANPFTVYRHDPNNPNSLSLGLPHTILEDRAGRLWIGFLGNWINRLDRSDAPRPRGSEPAYTISRYPQEYGVDYLYQDRTGTIWAVNGRDYGISHLDPGRPNLIDGIVHDPADSSSVARSPVNTILEDETGDLWLATYGSGIDRFDRATGAFRHYTPSDGLIDAIVFWIYRPPSDPDVIWAGTLRGLSRLDVKTDRFTNFDDEVLHPTYMMIEDRQGRFWVATGNGLHRFDRACGCVAETFTTREGLAHDEVWSVHEDKRGLLWLSTSGGLSRFDPATHAFRNFYERDGLPDNVFGEKAKYQSPSGELFYGGINGIVAFYPEDVIDEPVQPEVVLTGLRIDEEPVQPGADHMLEAPMPYTESVSLSHAQNDLTFEFVGLQFLDPLQTSYRYRLEGQDDDWIEGGTQRTARYTNLDPGSYTFHVSARNGSSVWNETEASVRVTILPPWWQTWWAYTLYALLLAAAVFTVDRTQRRRLIRRERQRAELRAAEERTRTLEELDHMKSRFFANLSHEFRTPLTLLLGPLDHFIRSADTPSDRRDLAMMQRQAHRLLRLINQLLDLSRLDAGQLTLHARRIDLVDTLRDLVLAFAPRAEREQIVLQFTPSVETAEAFVDPDKFEKTVANLLANAFTFTPSGGRVRVGLATGTDGDGAYAELTVKDTGHGIANDELPRIFDRFYQVDASRTRRHEGSGIGLALVRELVERHGGRIRVESEPGFGTTFFVRFRQGRDHLRDDDLADDSEAEPETTSTPFTADETSVEGRSADAPAHARLVLVVEDNPDVRAYLRRHLGPHYRVEEAVDGHDGLERARALRPDLVLADVMMPRLDGVALCAALKADDDLNHIPVILLTARAEEEDRIEGLGTGADDYVTKPFSMAELLIRIENLIEVRRALREHYGTALIFEPTGAVVEAGDAAFLEQVRGVIEAELGNSAFTVEVLADAVGLGVRQLYRRTKALTQMTPGALIRLMRLRRAAQLLEHGADRVSEVAYAVGFSDAHYFAKLFRQTFGVRPSEYKGPGSKV